MDIEIVPISKKINRKDFDCGIEELNTYLRQFAIPNDKKNIGKTFVAVENQNLNKPVGYYTVSMAQILFNELPEAIKKGLPRYPIPAMRIGKLAIDSESQGNKIGALLLKDALLRAVNISSQVALHFVVVDALNEKAKSFYLKYGFSAFEENPLTLVISLETIKVAIS
ncbi:MAG: GNAT family N-acetyltransferase [Spirochaetaceae bacterium]|jgi:GNAT superfamily N-acetyltransferase|nr:GNAT family N-acetyltransferase [Spirochaetaceae bacterium]